MTLVIKIMDFGVVVGKSQMKRTHSLKEGHNPNILWGNLQYLPQVDYAI
jgi:hypothetical protein